MSEANRGMGFGATDGGTYDLAIAGTGFAGSFFLSAYLEHAGPDERILVLERGGYWDHARRVSERRNSPIEPSDAYRTSGDLAKEWRFTLGFGGGSNCWWGNTPRMVAADFEAHTRFGVGLNWPVSYDDLEFYYARAERMMSVSGPEEPWASPRSVPYPQPAHRMNAPERLLKQHYPDTFFTTPTARARQPTKGRPSCCGNGVCHLCPVDAKFTVENAMMAVYDDPRVTVMLEAEVEAVDMEGGRATGFIYRKANDDRSTGETRRVRADVVAVAANALFNPVILQRSGLTHPLLGRRLHEQVGLRAEVFLDGVDSFDGSTSVTGHGMMLYDDDVRRRTMAPCLIETWNVGLLRRDPGRWRQVLPVRMVFEDLPLEENVVSVAPDEAGGPVAHTVRRSDYALKAIANARADLERVMAPLPVESIEFHAEVEPTEAHIMGTTVMGTDAATSVVDADSRHHDVRNLLVLGGSTFPTGPPANPTLTIAALSLRAADRLWS
ncbi:GMC family oxidoreductase [Rhizobiaceae bacterium]|nr:GMC family oxidoreductase [Rhizobiaceae bacterium]